MRKYLLALALVGLTAGSAFAENDRSFGPGAIGVPSVSDCAALPYVEQQRACLNDIEAYYHPSDAAAQARVQNDRQAGRADPYAYAVPLPGQPAPTVASSPLDAQRTPAIAAVH